MAKTAIINIATGALVGLGQSAGTNKMVIEAAGLTEDQVKLVTAKNFEPSDEFKTFKDLTMTQEDRDAAAAKAAEKAQAAAEKAAKAAEAGEKAPRAKSSDLAGEYHILKPFPATAADHPKMPIWEAISGNNTVEAAKAACPETNPPRKTNGVYTFTSEFRYFLKAGYVGMGAAPEPVDTAEPEAETAAE